MKRVIAKMYITYTGFGRDRETNYELIQYLQIKLNLKAFGYKFFSYWKTIDTEIVPSYAWISRNTLGFTNWLSKWHEIDNIKWINHT